jgi:protein-tyrosine kinase
MPFVIVSAGAIASAGQAVGAPPARLSLMHCAFRTGPDYYRGWYRLDGVCDELMVLELRIIKDPCRDVPKPRVRAFGDQGGDIGRAPDSYWVLPDPKGYVSAQHCSVEFRDGTYWLRDTSRNGVYLNGSREPVGRGGAVPLRHGDRVRLAEYELLVRLQKEQIADEFARSRDELLKSAIANDPAYEHDKRSSTASDLRRLTIDASGDVVAGSESQLDAHGPAELTSTVAYSEVHVADRPDFGARLPADGDDQQIHGKEQAEGDPAEPASRSEALLKRTRSLVAAVVGKLRHDDPETDAARMAWNPTDTGGFAAAAGGTAGRLAGIRKSASFDRATMERYCVLPAVGDAAAFNAYKILRTRIRRRMAASQWRSIGISGAGEAVGKTLTAMNLSIVFAQDPRSPTILVDLDLYRPKLAAYLGMPFDKGLTDYLLGEADVSDIIYSTEISGLAIVPNGRPLQNASELLGSQRMSDLVLALESLAPHRTIIYDLPPLLMSDDVLLFSPHVDCLLDVVAVGVTPRAALERSREVLAELNVIGVVVNRAPSQDTPNYYYYK